MSPSPSPSNQTTACSAEKEPPAPAETETAPSLRWTQLSLQAASQLRAANYDRAENLFSQALVGLEQSLPELQDALPAGNSSSDPADQNDAALSVKEFYQQELQSLHQMQQQQFQQHQQQQQSPSDLDLDWGTKAYLVKVPLPKQLQEQQDQQQMVRVYQKLILPSEDTQSHVFWFMALLYNMGLVHHLRGIHQGKDSAFNSALQMYETAMGFQQEFFPASKQQQQQPSSYSSFYHQQHRPSGTLRVLLELAMSNNCAHIYSNFLDPLSVEDYVTDMAMNLSLLQPGMGIQEQDYRFFLLNGRHARSLEQQPAPQA